MGDKTGISWCDHTFNPWVGCTKVSDGCKFCYAEHDTFPRVKRAQRIETWGPQGTRIRTSAANWKKPLKWNLQLVCCNCGANEYIDKINIAFSKHSLPQGVCAYCHSFTDFRSARVFCASLADVFEDNPQVEEWRLDLFELIAKTPNLDWLLLTKRPENILRMTHNRLNNQNFFDVFDNVWIGATVENQKAAEERIPELLKVPAKVRFLSVEPMLAPLQLPPNATHLGGGIQWVICGFESGPHARLENVEQKARNLRDQCQRAGIRFFMKQLGGHPDKRDRMEDLPEDLRIREWPHPNPPQISSLGSEYLGRGR